MTILAAPITPELPGLFRRAAAVVEKNGLNKGWFVAGPAIPDAHGQLHPSPDEAYLRPVCTVGAIRVACGWSPEQKGLIPLAQAAIEFAVAHMEGEPPETDGEPDLIEHIADWNDATGRCPSEVQGRLLFWAIEAERELGWAA